MTYGNDHYPPGTPSPQIMEARFKCECGTEFDVICVTELGMASLDEELACPGCGNDDEEKMAEII